MLEMRPCELITSTPGYCIAKEVAKRTLKQRPDILKITSNPGFKDAETQLDRIIVR